MSLPTLTSGSLSTTRKSGWRLLPEIHASRLSVSGSLRPKLGLLILSILLLISLCFVLVPVLSKLKFPYNRIFFSPRDLPLQKLYYQLTGEESKTVILTPGIIISAASFHNHTSSYCGSSDSSPSDVINSTAVVFFNKDRGNSFLCKDDRIRVIFKQFGTDQFLRSIEKEIEKNTLDYSALQRISKSVIITKTLLNLHIPGVLKDDNLLVRGIHQVVHEKDRTVVKIDNLQSDLELFLIKPRERRVSSLNYSLLDMSQYGRNRVQILLPTQLIRSSLSLSSRLSNFGISDKESSFYHKTSLRFLPQANSVHYGEQEQSIVTELDLLDNFMFIVRHSPTNSVIMFGNVSSRKA